jgi:hypothetical protein
MTAKPSCGRSRGQRRRILIRGTLARAKARFREPRIYKFTRNDPVNLASVLPVCTLSPNGIAVVLLSL